MDTRTEELPAGPIVSEATGDHPERRGFYCVTFGTSAANRRKIAEATAAAKAAPLRELERVRAAYLADGPGRLVRELEGRIEDAKAAIRSAEHDVDRVYAAWSAAVAGNTDVPAHDEARRAATDRRTNLRERLQVLHAELVRAKEAARAGLRAALEKRHAELVEAHAASGRLAAAKERLAQAIAEPFAELMAAQAEADGINKARFERRYADLFGIE
jgi:hypothetical protein